MTVPTPCFPAGGAGGAGRAPEGGAAEECKACKSSGHHQLGWHLAYSMNLTICALLTLLRV
jgi:hypothetical protein